MTWRDAGVTLLGVCAAVVGAIAAGFVLLADMDAFAAVEAAAGGPAAMGGVVIPLLWVGGIASALTVGWDARRHGRGGWRWGLGALAVPLAPGYLAGAAWLAFRRRDRQRGVRRAARA